MIWTPLGLRLELRKDPGMTIEELAARFLDDADIVISEIYQGVKRAKLEYLPQGAGQELADDPGLKAVITGQAARARCQVPAPEPPSRWRISSWPR